MTASSIILKSGREKSVLNRHPRLFSGAIKEIDGRPKDGEIVDVRDNHGAWLARGLINQQAQIAVRLLTWDERETVDGAFWAARVARAAAARGADPRLAGTDARRLVFGESDGLPGIIADDYAGTVVVEVSALAAMRNLDPILAALRAIPGVQATLLHYDAERLAAEGLRAPAPAEPGAASEFIVREGGLRFAVEPGAGQKTGFYLDQRDNRARVAAYSAGARVLNEFSYSGAFALAALAAGAREVINVDSSADALRLARRNVALNAEALAAAAPGSSPGSAQHVEADAFADLRARREIGEKYDMVILDPPKFAHNLAQVDRAARAYKDLNRIGLQLVRPGGVLVTFSCSGMVDAALFQKILFSASLEARRDAQVVERLSQASDHPVLLSYPESEYLKGLVLRVG